MPAQYFDSPAEYRAKRDRLVAAMRGRHNNEVRLQKTSASNLFRNRQEGAQRLDVRDLNRVISVNPDTLVAEVEGMTTYETFVDGTLQYSCLPTVTPQLNTITVGGAVAGGGIESSSFRFGLVHETVLEMEILLSSGEIVTASPKQHRDLFYGLPNTFGTLGYILKLKVKLMPAKPYVQLRHIPFTDSKEFFHAIDQIAKSGQHEGIPVDFMDGSVFDQGQHFLTLGRLTDQVPYTSDYTYMKMYYRSIKNRQEDYMTTRDYVWRWDPDWFWCSDRFGADKWLVRLIIGKWLLHSRSYWKIISWDRKYHLGERLERLTPKRPKRESVIQDVQVPINKAPAFLDFLHQKIGILPIWICPARDFGSHRFDFLPLETQGTYINFGFWDYVETTRDPAKGYYNRLIEQRLEKIKGTKGLYSEAYYTPEEFWQIYDHARYSKLKQKYDPSHTFKDLYQKTVQRG